MVVYKEQIGDMEFSVSFTELASEKSQLDKIRYPNELRWDHTPEKIRAMTA